MAVVAISPDSATAQTNCARVQNSGTSITGGSSACTYIVHDIGNGWAKVCEDQGSVSCPNLNAGEHRVTAYTSSPWNKVEEYRVTLTASSNNNGCNRVTTSGNSITGGSSSCTYIVHDVGNGWAKVCQDQGSVSCPNLNAGEHRVTAYTSSPWNKVEEYRVTLTASSSNNSQPVSNPTPPAATNNNSGCSRVNTSGTSITGGSTNCTYIVHDIGNSWTKVCQDQGSVSCPNLNAGEHRVSAYESNPWEKVEDYRVTITAGSNNSQPATNPTPPAATNNNNNNNNACTQATVSGTSITGGSTNCNYIIYDIGNNWSKVCQSNGPIQCPELNASKHRITAYTSNPWKRVQDYEVTLTASSNNSQPATNPTPPAATNNNNACTQATVSGTSITGGSTNCNYIIYDIGNNWSKVCQSNGPVQCPELNASKHRITAYTSNPWKRVQDYEVTLTANNSGSANTTSASNSGCNSSSGDHAISDLEVTTNGSKEIRVSFVGDCDANSHIIYLSNGEGDVRRLVEADVTSVTFPVELFDHYAVSTSSAFRSGACNCHTALKQGPGASVSSMELTARQAAEISTLTGPAVNVVRDAEEAVNAAERATLASFGLVVTVVGSGAAVTGLWSLAGNTLGLAIATYGVSGEIDEASAAYMAFEDGLDELLIASDSSPVPRNGAYDQNGVVSSEAWNQFRAFLPGEIRNYFSNNPDPDTIVRLVEELVEDHQNRWGEPGDRISQDTCTSAYSVACSDLDGDGTPDHVDPDIDGDGYPNDEDLFPNTVYGGCGHPNCNARVLAPETSSNNRPSDDGPYTDPVFDPEDDYKIGDEGEFGGTPTTLDD